MEYNELKKLIETKKNESDKLYKDYTDMCDKYFSEREKNEAELKNLYFAYMVKPETKIIGRCFKDGNCSYKILDTGLEERVYGSNDVSYGVPFKTLGIIKDELNGDYICIMKHHTVPFKNILFGENEIALNEFNDMLNKSIEEMRSL